MGNQGAHRLIQRQRLQEQSRRVMWFELYPGVLSLVAPGDATIDQVAAYVSGNPEVARALSDVNNIGRSVTITQGRPILVPVELIDRMQAVRDMPESLGAKVLTLRQVSAENAAFRNFVTVRGGHPLGPDAAGLIPVTMQTVERFAAGLPDLLPNWAVYGISFTGGVVHGFLKSIGDTAGALWHLMKSLVSLQLISEIRELIDKVRALSWQDVRDSIGEWAERWDDELQSPDPALSGHARGYIAGYAMAEAAMLLLSGGTLTELKGAIWASRLGEILKSSRALRTLAEGVTTISNVAGKVAPLIEGLRGSRLGALVRAAELTGTGIVWTAGRVMWVLNLPSHIAMYVAEKMVAHVKQLERFFPRIERLSERGKRWLFGCHSPCKWDPDAVEGILTKETNGEIEKAAEAAPEKAPDEPDNTPSIEAGEVPNPPIEDEPTVIVDPSASRVSRKMMAEYIRRQRKIVEDHVLALSPRGEQGALGAQFYRAQHMRSALTRLRSKLPQSGLSLSPEAEKLYAQTIAELDAEIRRIQDIMYPPKRDPKLQGPVPVKAAPARPGNPVPFPPLRPGKRE